MVSFRTAHLLWPALCAGLAAAGVPPAETAGTATGRVERFWYTTVRAGDEARVEQERVRLEMHFAGGRITTVYHSARQDGTETATVRMLEDGTVLDAEKREIDAAGEPRACSRLWLEGDTVCIERTRGGGQASRRCRDRKGLDVVADAGLLARLRRFPFDSGRGLSFLMAGFPQHFIRMKVQQVGRARIAVPAGEFECYVLEASIDLFIKEFRMTYWVACDPPHFLVRYEGKRGLFLSPTYVTELNAFELFE